MFSETWLKANILNSEVLCDRYSIARRDRVVKTGGGVLIAVLNSLNYDIIPTNIDDIEFLSVSVIVGAAKLYITCSYIPPSSQFSVYESHLGAISQVSTLLRDEDRLLILGDFNLPHVSWLPLSDTGHLTPLTPCDWSSDFINHLSSINLVQINGIANAMNRTLDLVLVNDSDNFEVSRMDPISYPEDSYHPTVGICYSYQGRMLSLGESSKKMFCFSRANYFLLNNLLETVDWDSLLFCENRCGFDRALIAFYDTIWKFIGKSVPSASISVQPESPPWSSKQLRQLKNAKSRLYRKFKRSGSTFDYSRYSIARCEYEAKSRRSYATYLNKIGKQFRENPKSFFKFVKIKRNSAATPSRVKRNNVEYTDAESIANCFADFFASVYSNDSIPDNFEYPYLVRSLDPFGVTYFEHTWVRDNLLLLKPTNSFGPDGIPNSILKYCSDNLARPLTMLFNASLKLGYIPTMWKSSYLIPLHKSGSIINVSNYRGIAKLSAIPKLFEKLMTDIISHKISSIIDCRQHGFRKGLSTVTNLLQFSSHIIEGFISGLQTDVVYTDFSKAFDKVNHRILLHKLNAIGFNGNIIDWISSYLTGREQMVTFGDSISRPIHVTSGVPQGSHLGPVLFLLFINDLPNSVLNSKLLMYADDVKIYLTYKNALDQVHLQNDLDSLHTWCGINLMELNLKKCKHMIFSRSRVITSQYTLGGFTLELVNSFIDLGILLDGKLTFNSHIITTVNKAYGVLSFIKRWAKEFSDPYITKNLFTSLVRPILEYGSVVWDPQYDFYVNMLESVQKQFLLFCLRNLRWDPNLNLPPYASRLSLIKLPTLASRRTMLNSMTIYKILRGEIRSEYLIGRVLINVPLRPSRNYKPLYISFQRQNYAFSEPLRRMCSDFNCVYQFIDFSLSADIIKSYIINYLNT